MVATLRKIVRFYCDGFREMTLGRTLWAVILIKLFIMFAVLRLFFFPDLLAGKSPEERSNIVLEALTSDNQNATRQCPTSCKPSTGPVPSLP